MKHESWEKQSSLTSPSDQNSSKPSACLGSTTPPLTDQELKEALSEQQVSSFIGKFPKLERLYADPHLSLQKYGLISFVPAQGAKPNSNGVYGFAKLRGNFQTEQEASERSEHIIRNVDSYHKIFTCYVGRPFPLTLSSRYSEETAEIDLRKETVKCISNSVKIQKEKERNDIQDIKSREKALLDDVTNAVEPFERYVELQVKKAQLMWTYQKAKDKMKELRELAQKAQGDIANLEKDNPEFKDKHFDHYMKARKEAGLEEEDEKTAQESFIKYLNQDIDW